MVGSQVNRERPQGHGEELRVGTERADQGVVDPDLPGWYWSPQAGV